MNLLTIYLLCLMSFACFGFACFKDERGTRHPAGVLFRSDFALKILEALVISVLAISALFAEVQNGQYTDLDRMYIEMQGSIDWGFEFLLGIYGMNPGSAVILYAVALTGCFSLVKPIAVIGTYFFLFRTITESCTRLNLPTWMAYVGHIVVLCICPYVLVFANVRFYLAAALVCFGMARFLFFRLDCWRARVPIVLSIVCGVLIHLGTLFILIPAVALYGNKAVFRVFCVLLLTLPVLLPLLSWVTFLLQEASPIIYSLHGKLELYTFSGDAYAMFGSQGVNTYVAIILLSLLSFLIFQYFPGDAASVAPAVRRFFVGTHALHVGLILNVDLLYRVITGGFPLLMFEVFLSLNCLVNHGADNRNMRVGLKVLMGCFFLIVGVFLVRNSLDIANWAAA